MPPKSMHVYIMTDLEGVGGVQNFADWCMPGGRYYETGKEFLTMETNAVIEGFFAGGASAVTVADGHGHGAINPLLLDERAELISHWFKPYYPFLLDNRYAAAAWVGQHARSGSEYAHLPHTGSCDVLERAINGKPVGEFEELALCAAELGIPVIFCSGDEAFCQQAREFSGAIETVSVKRGTRSGRGNECDADAYRARNLSAVHLHPHEARRRVRAGSERAIRKFIAGPRAFAVPVPPPPYRLEVRMRPGKETPPRRGAAAHPTSIIALLNQKVDLKPADGAD